MKWETICRRTNDPKLQHFQDMLSARGIVSRRNGESLHAPILDVPELFAEDAWNLLSSDVFGDGACYDDIADDDPVFGEV